MLLLVSGLETYGFVCWVVKELFRWLLREGSPLSTQSYLLPSSPSWDGLPTTRAPRRTDTTPTRSLGSPTHTFHPLSLSNRSSPFKKRDPLTYPTSRTTTIPSSSSTCTDIRGTVILYSTQPQLGCTRVTFHHFGVECLKSKLDTDTVPSLGKRRTGTSMSSPSFTHREVSGSEGHQVSFFWLEVLPSFSSSRLQYSITLTSSLPSRISIQPPVWRSWTTNQVTSYPHSHLLSDPFCWSKDQTGGNNG